MKCEVNRMDSASQMKPDIGADCACYRCESEGDRRRDSPSCSLSDHTLSDKIQSDAVELPANIEFRDPRAATQSLARLRAFVSETVLAAFLQLLSSSPSPDSVVVLFERLMEPARDELATVFEKQPILIHYATLVFGYSGWLGETLIQNIDLFGRFGRARSLDRSYSREEFREEFARMHARSPGSDMAVALARFRKREYVRILLRDVLGIAKLAETTEEISALSDALIEEASLAVKSQQQHRHGTPQWVDAHGRLQDSRFAVVSLGKLGGNELNYSSDIDLMFLYDGGARTSDTTYFEPRILHSFGPADHRIVVATHPGRTGVPHRPPIASAGS